MEYTGFFPRAEYRASYDGPYTAEYADEGAVFHVIVVSLVGSSVGPVFRSRKSSNTGTAEG